VKLMGMHGDAQMLRKITSAAISLILIAAFVFVVLGMLDSLEVYDNGIQTFDMEGE